MTQPTFEHSLPSVNIDSDQSDQRNQSMPLSKAELLALFTMQSDATLSHTDQAQETVESSVAEQRLALYHEQHERTRLLYLAPASTRPTYLVQTLKTQFAEYQQYKLAQQLDKRGLLDVAALELWQQLHVVDDIIADIVRHMPAQKPAGWQLTAQDGHNPLRIATIGKLRHPGPSVIKPA